MCRHVCVCTCTCVMDMYFLYMYVYLVVFTVYCGPGNNYYLCVLSKHIHYSKLGEVS